MGCIFQGLFPFHLSYQIHLHKIVIIHHLITVESNLYSVTFLFMALVICVLLLLNNNKNMTAEVVAKAVHREKFIASDEEGMQIYSNL